MQILFVQMLTDAVGKAGCGGAGQTDPQDSPEIKSANVHSEPLHGPNCPAFSESIDTAPSLTLGASAPQGPATFANADPRSQGLPRAGFSWTQVQVLTFQSGLLVGIHRSHWKARPRARPRPSGDCYVPSVRLGIWTQSALSNHFSKINK